MNGSDADDQTGPAGSAAPTAEHEAGPGESVVEPAVTEAATTTASVAHARLEGESRLARPNRISSILVAVGPGPHSGATVDLARRLADATDAWLELFHVVPSDAGVEAAELDATDGRDGSDSGGAGGNHGNHGNHDAAADPVAAGEALLAAADDRLGDFERADRWLVEARSAADAIVEQSPYYDLVVVGAPTTGTVGRFVFGSTTDTVVDDAEVPVVVVEADGTTALRDA
ncbi:UspA domain protein [Halorubrum aidingense JCM 13560]|uniref:UspA domain protein n=1 Tax=Halorubrum aidingense JCM 13560 TaxID=1230454 RepID=M0PAP7_9EURY|nr:universal stress protein [Halorubrum aidingense]EMA66928.1 UspA domain protein [Halorubrum aidingense JCM 13560]